MTVSSVGVLPIEVRDLTSGQEVAISGRIDVHSVPDVRLLLHEIIDTGSGDILMRLGDAEIGDSTGLGVLVEAFNRARRAGRRLAVVDMTARTERLLRASRLDRALVQREAAEAARAAGAPPLWRLSPPEPLPRPIRPRVPSPLWPTTRTPRPPLPWRPAGSVTVRG